MIKNNNIVELYIHIPFCVKKCAYCDFLSAPADDETIEQYVRALIREVEAYKDVEKRTVSTVFIGGGTPSVLSCGQVERIFSALRSVFRIDTDAEITIEVNPGTVTEEKMQTYMRCGINRISIGLQSTDNQELQLLGRIHTYEEFAANFALARRCGFDNINVDLISAIPGQSVESWERSLRDIITLSPEHISAYSLIVEPDTPFWKLYGEGGVKEKELPSEEKERQMYHLTEEILMGAGYQRYEISNYAKEGKECRHNLGYWERTPYLGLGLGAATLEQTDIRYRNTTDMNNYLEHSSKLNEIHIDYEHLRKKERMEEFVFLGLRKIEGISLLDFETCFGSSLYEHYEEGIRRMQRQGFVEETEGRLRLTREGLDVSNVVFAEILYM